MTLTIKIVIMMNHDDYKLFILHMFILVNLAKGNFRGRNEGNALEARI